MQIPVVPAEEFVPLELDELFDALPLSDERALFELPVLPEEPVDAEELLLLEPAPGDVLVRLSLRRALVFESFGVELGVASTEVLADGSLELLSFNVSCVAAAAWICAPTSRVPMMPIAAAPITAAVLVTEPIALRRAGSYGISNTLATNIQWIARCSAVTTQSP